MLVALLAAGTPAAQAGSSSGAMTVSATVLSKNVCKFSSKTLALDFQAIDPSSSVPKTAAASVGFVCNGSSASASYFISAGDGLHPTGLGARRMRNATVPTEFLPYALSWTPTSGIATKGVAQTLSFSGSIAPANFQQARPGSYSDTVIITVAP